MPNCCTFTTALLCAGIALAASPDGGQPKAEDDQLLFGDLPKVEAVALHGQTLAEAPANVTVITAEQIRRYGYRTLAEALNSVRGFYVTYDHAYHYVGVSGISLPGDFNTRFLVMLNGHPLTDNIYNSNGFFGQDFGLDMDLVDRIEIIRGPTSALYGSNGMLANINVVTHSPVDAERLRLASDWDSEGERKISVSSSLYLGGGANLLVSASVFNSTGMSFDAVGLGVPANLVAAPGMVSGIDGERGYHAFGNLIWRGWSFTAYFNSRDKQFPVGIGNSLAGDPGQRMVDGRSLVGARYKGQAGPGTLRFQLFYDQYRYHDRFDYPLGGGVEALNDENRGDWLDTQVSYELPVPRVGPLTLGAQGFWELRNQQFDVVQGVQQDMASHPDRGVALFAQQEWNLSPRWKLDGGVRLDHTRNFHSFVSPRLAAVYQPSTRTAWKIVYGRPFRNPSTFEQFYNDGGLSYAAAPALHPETAHTFEASLERRLGHGVTAVVNGFHYRIDHVIEAVTLDSGAQQYRNAGRLRSTGAEVELDTRPWDRLELSASTALAWAGSGGTSAPLANSPRQVGKGRLGAPLFRDRLFLAASLEYVSARGTVNGNRLGGPLLADFTATARLHRRLDLQAGVRNAFDRRYEDPVCLTIDSFPGEGRATFVRLVWRAWE